MNEIKITLLVLALAVSPGIVSAQEHGHSLEQLVVEMAETPEQHEALARHFRARADEARSEMQRHERMARSYGGGKISQRQQMRRHCQGISERYAAIAEDLEALAKLHDEEAKKSD